MSPYDGEGAHGVVSDVDTSNLQYSSWSGPRTVTVPRTDQGFGFTLRHFIVYPPDTSVQDQILNIENDEDYDQKVPKHKHSRLSNLDPMDTIFVKYVKEDGPADLAGLNTGDRVLSVNGETVTGKSYSNVIDLIQASGSRLQLVVVPRDEDILQMAYPNTAFTAPVDQKVVSGVGVGSGNPIITQARPLTVSAMNMGSSSTPADQEDKQRRRYASQEFEPSFSSSAGFSSAVNLREPFQSDRMFGNSSTGMGFKKAFPKQISQDSLSTGVECGAPPTRSTSYSFGLYFPVTGGRRESKENVTPSKGGGMCSKENIAPPNTSTSAGRSQSSINIRTDSSLDRFKSPVESDSQYSYSWKSQNRHSFPDQSNLITSPHSSPFTPQPVSHSSILSGSAWNSTSYVNRDERDGAVPVTHRHYIPVVSHGSYLPTYKSPISSSSVDNVNSRTGYQRPGAQVVVQIGDRGCRGGTPVQTTTSPLSNPQASYGTAFALTRSPVTTKIQVQKNQRPIVSHRLKQFENNSSEVTKSSPSNNTNNNNNNQVNRYKVEIEKMTTYKKFESVADRTAQFERRTSESPPKQPEVSPVQPSTKVRKLSGELISKPFEQKQNQSNISQGNVPLSYPEQQAPITIFVSQNNSDSTSTPILQIVPMFRGDRSQPTQVVSPSTSLQNIYSPPVIEEQSALSPQRDDKRIVKPVRKTSYLTAVNAPKYSQPVLPSVFEMNSQDENDSVGELMHHSPNTQCNGAGLLSIPESSPHDIGNSIFPTRHLRRTVRFDSPERSVEESSSSYHSDDSARQMMSPVSKPPVVLRKKSDISPEDEAVKLHRRTSYLMATAKDRNQNGNFGANTTVSPVTIPPTIEIVEGNTLETPPSKHPSIKKLKSFFGEKTPKILEAAEKHHEALAASPIQDKVKEGQLICKTALTDRKRSSDRSWKPMWTVLRGHALYLFKDKKEATSMPYTFDDQPISIKSCIVDIAYDYTKKKNVFRLTTYNGSEYLFQADDHETMISWIQAIQMHNDPDLDEKGVGNADLILRKTSLYDQGPCLSKTSPQTTQKISKKGALAGLSFKGKIHVPHSPSLRRKKMSTDKDADPSKLKMWKGKLHKSFKKQGSTSTVSSHMEPHQSAFGLSLEDCIPSPNNEFVPLIVDLCTKIVEAKGLEVIGVYRVPGNSAAVSMMQEELKKGIDHLNTDNEKWFDVNVISSLLKAFFRKLPEPLIPEDLYDKIIKANRIENAEKRMLHLKKLVHDLPEHNFETFKHLSEHLQKVARYSAANKMDFKNLAIVFGPTLIRKSGDDMTTLVADMSDQCKIVESVLSHCDWFFSSWDVDNYVPVDDNGSSITTLSSDSTLDRTDLDDDDEKSIDPKEIVTSIIRAASRKLQVKDKGVDETDFPEVVDYNERNIDREISQRKHLSLDSVLADTRQETTPIQFPLAGSQDTMDRIGRYVPPSLSEQKVLAPMASFDSDLDWEIVDPREYRSSDKKGYMKGQFSRQYSDDSMDNNDELEISHGLDSQLSFSRDTLDRLRRIELEARALREREEQRQREWEKRQLAKKRIEQELQQTKRELEMEENHSVEDLLQQSGQSWNSQYSDVLKSDSTSLMSEYSTTSSRTDSGKYQSSKSKYGITSDYSSSTSPVTVNHDSRQTLLEMAQNHSTPKDGDSNIVPRGKYFVSVGNINPSAQQTFESKAKRTSSLENVLESTAEPHQAPAKLREKKETDNKDSSKRGSRLLSRSSSLRRSSLDSLLDMYDKHEQRLSWVSTDSEDGSDLLTSLTSTFDQKLQILLNPKYKFSSDKRLVRMLSGGKVDDSSSGSSTEVGDHLPLSSLKDNQTKKLQSSKAHPQFVRVGPENFFDKHFRDPSLHRASKSETKIGIASRFERNNAPYRTCNQFLRPESFISTTAPTTSSPTSTKMSLPESISPKVTEAGQTSDSLSVLHPVQRLLEDSKSVNGKQMLVRPGNARALNSASQQLTDNSDNIIMSSVSQSSGGTTQPVRRRIHRHDKRRHTVGGVKDLDNFMPIEAETNRLAEEKVSAWDQLQPRDTGKDSSVLSWMKRERLRLSVPDLSSTVDDEFEDCVE